MLLTTFFSTALVARNSSRVPVGGPNNWVPIDARIIDAQIQGREAAFLCLNGALA